MNLPAVYSMRDSAKLWALYVAMETHHRGLQALMVDQDSYEKIVVPSLLDKLSETVWPNLLLGKQHEERTMDELLVELLAEVELREEHSKPKLQQRDYGGRED